MPYVLPLSKLRMTDVATVGGKNASLGELISQLDKAGVRVPGGFATTADAFQLFLKHNNLGEKIQGALEGLDVDDVFPIDYDLSALVDDRAVNASSLGVPHDEPLVEPP